MKILYRISEGGNKKYKPSFVYDKKNMFLHFIKIFKDQDIYVFADNVGDDLYNFILNNYNKSKVFRISLGNAKSFIYTVDFAIKFFNNNDKLYFAEDDYIYKVGADKIIEEGLDIAEYSSGYDHPDKYINYEQGGPNPFIQEGGELTRVILTANSHWKLTNSFCMTFATRVKTIKEDYEILNTCCQGSDPGDFGFFCNIREKHNRKLVSSIPSVSTHGEVQWLAKFVNWENEFKKSFEV